MPINAYTGLMRSGKSDEVVSEVIGQRHRPIRFLALRLAQGRGSQISQAAAQPEITS